MCLTLRLLMLLDSGNQSRPAAWRVEVEAITNLRNQPAPAPNSWLQTQRAGNPGSDQEDHSGDPAQIADLPNYALDKQLLFETIKFWVGLLHSSRCRSFYWEKTLKEDRVWIKQVCLDMLTLKSNWGI